MLDHLKATVRTIPDFPKPGIQFKDITPVLADPKLLKLAVIALAEPWQDARITKVIGIESRGFILGAMLAERLGAGFVPVRKEGKLPFSTLKESYGLEYGIDTIEMHTDALVESDIVLIHDDVIATGGTAAAAQRLVESTGARTAGYSFLIHLTFLDGQSKLMPSLTCHSLIQY